MKFLPPHFDQLDSFIAPDFYAPLIGDDDDDAAAVKWQMKRFKHLQETKRTWLAIHMQAHEANMAYMECHYQQELNQFERQQGIALSQPLKAYLDHRHDRRRDDLSMAMTHVRRTLLRRRRTRSLLAIKQVVGVSPEVIFDDPRHVLNAVEREYLSRGMTNDT